MARILLPVPHYKQLGIYNCLPACARMGLSYVGKHVSEEELVGQLGTTALGTPGSRLLRLQNAELEVFYGSLTLSLLHNSLERGIPVIVLVNTFFLDYWQSETAHAVLVIGYDEEGVFLNDPAFETAPQKASENGFLAAWGEFDYLGGIIQKR